MFGRGELAGIVQDQPPFRDYYFATAAGDVVAVPVNKVVAIHKVVAGEVDGGAQ